MNQPNTESMSRRHFLNTSTTLVLASVAAPRWAARAAAVNGDTLRVGLIGCGGRGSGAATQALAADNNVVLTAMADAFPDRIEKSLADLKKAAGDKVKVTSDYCFAGFDAYQQLLDSGVYEYPNGARGFLFTRQQANGTNPCRCRQWRCRGKPNSSSARGAKMATGASGDPC